MMVLELSFMNISKALCKEVADRAINRSLACLN